MLNRDLLAKHIKELMMLEAGLQPSFTNEFDSFKQKVQDDFNRSSKYSSNYITKHNLLMCKDKLTTLKERVEQQIQRLESFIESATDSENARLIYPHNNELFYDSFNVESAYREYKNEKQSINEKLSANRAIYDYIYAKNNHEIHIARTANARASVMTGRFPFLKNDIISFNDRTFIVESSNCSEVMAYEKLKSTVSKKQSRFYDLPSDVKHTKASPDWILIDKAIELTKKEMENANG